jgi:hypothetical protein
MKSTQSGWSYDPTTQTYQHFPSGLAVTSQYVMANGFPATTPFAKGGYIKGPGNSVITTPHLWYRLDAAQPTVEELEKRAKATLSQLLDTIDIDDFDVLLDRAKQRYQYLDGYLQWWEDNAIFGYFMVTTIATRIATTQVLSVQNRRTKPTLTAYDFILAFDEHSRLYRNAYLYDVETFWPGLVYKS